MASGDGYSTWNPEEAIALLKLESDALDVGNPVESAGSILADAAPRAASSIAFLAVHSRDEKVRLQAAKYVIDATVNSRDGNDPFAELLKQMSDS